MKKEEKIKYWCVDTLMERRWTIDAKKYKLIDKFGCGLWRSNMTYERRRDKSVFASDLCIRPCRGE